MKTLVTHREKLKTCFISKNNTKMRFKIKESNSSLQKKIDSKLNINASLEI